MKQILLLMTVVAAMAGCAAERTVRLAAELDGIFQPLFPDARPRRLAVGLVGTLRSVSSPADLSSRIVHRLSV